ncbi:MAG: biotin transporter BioY [Clostridia bacterium]|nr:biotin transporter BioY [Clostridia bacterium]
MNKTFSPRNLAYSGIFVAFLCVSGILSVPIPMTAIELSLQTAVVVVLACVLDRKLAFLTILAYILLGLTGVPVFSQGGGIAYVFKPSFGFLLGFAAGAYALSAIYSSSKFKKRFTAFLVGSAAFMIIVYTFGVAYMYMILNYYMNVEISLPKAIALGALPFIGWDLAKSALAYGIIIALEKATGKSQRPL